MRYFSTIEIAQCAISLFNDSSMRYFRFFAIKVTKKMYREKCIMKENKSTSCVNHIYLGLSSLSFLQIIFICRKQNIWILKWFEWQQHSIFFFSHKVFILMNSLLWYSFIMMNKLSLLTINWQLKTQYMFCQLSVL